MYDAWTSRRLHLFMSVIWAAVACYGSASIDLSFDEWGKEIQDKRRNLCYNYEYEAVAKLYSY